MTIYGFEVSDRFVNYGVVIIALVKGQEIMQFVMSCRVIGLEVEMAAIRVIEAEMRGKAYLEAIAVSQDTGANLLSRDLFAGAGYTSVSDGYWVRSLDRAVPYPVHITERHEHDG
jgi:predicted enzyme involved in methoxymalonyl-ACP biosynthesis